MPPIVRRAGCSAAFLHMTLAWRRHRRASPTSPNARRPALAAWQKPIVGTDMSRSAGGDQAPLGQGCPMCLKSPAQRRHPARGSKTKTSTQGPHVWTKPAERILESIAR
jgi:hypothetical protein